MLKSLINIDSSYRQIRWVVFSFLLFAGLLSGYAIMESYNNTAQARKVIYIYDEGSIIAAKAQSIQENRPVEARKHVEQFHEYFFSLSPDEKAIKYTIDRALFLADNSVETEYNNLVESNYYNKLISGNVSQRIRIEKVSLDSTSYPYKLTTYAKLEIVRPSTITLRNLVTTCSLREKGIARSDNNPHAFLIENWTVTDNSDIKTVKR